MGLPSMIAESTPAYVGFGSGAESVTWLRRYFELVRDYDMPAFSLITCNWASDSFWSQAYWNGFWPDARVAHFPDTRAAWDAQLADPRYLMAQGTQAGGSSVTGPAVC